MDQKKVTTKSLAFDSVSGVSEIDGALELINKHTIEPLNANDVFLFKVILCDNDIDRAYEKMSNEFLDAFASKSIGLTGLKDHDWESDNQLSRLYDVEVVVDETVTTKLGEPRKYVLGKAYTLRRFTDYIEKINAGLLKEVSVSFKSVNDTCSICGGKMVKGKGDIPVCENKHVGGQTYDNKLCYSNLTELEEVYEWSLVAVPCQQNSGIKNKSIMDGGNGIMKKSKFMLHKLLNSKAFKDADKETQEVMQKAVDAEEDTDLSDEDIKALVAENTKLKEKVATLEDKVKETETGRTRDKVESIVSKAIDAMSPLTPTVKENILRDMNIDSMKMEGDKVTGLDEALSGIKEKYKGLIAEEAEEKAEEAKEEAEEAEEEVDEKEVDEDEAEEKEKEEASEDVKHKGVRVNSGIKFGVTANKKSVQTTKNSMTIR
jgi:hypothetical protein